MHYIMDEEGEKAIAELLTRFPPDIPSFPSVLGIQRSAISTTKVIPMLQAMLQAPENFNEWLCDNIGIKDSYSRGMVLNPRWKKYRGDNKCQLVSRIHESKFAQKIEHPNGPNRIYHNEDRLRSKQGLMLDSKHGWWFPKHLEGRPDKLYWILKLYPTEERADGGGDDDWRMWKIILLWHETGIGTSTLEDLENHQAWVVWIEGDESCGGRNDGRSSVFHVEKAGPFAWRSIRNNQLKPEAMAEISKENSVITYAGAFDLLSSGKNQDYGLLNWRW